MNEDHVTIEFDPYEPLKKQPDIPWPTVTIRPGDGSPTNPLFTPADIEEDQP